MGQLTATRISWCRQLITYSCIRSKVQKYHPAFWLGPHFCCPSTIFEFIFTEVFNALYNKLWVCTLTVLIVRPILLYWSKNLFFYTEGEGTWQLTKGISNINLVLRLGTKYSVSHPLKSYSLLHPTIMRKACGPEAVKQKTFASQSPAAPLHQVQCSVYSILTNLWSAFPNANC